MSRTAPDNAKASDQMPEEGPAQQVPDDVPGAHEGAARDGARRSLKNVRRRIAKQRPPAKHSQKR
ncbi:MAG: hypothetical protein ACRDK2_11085 [Solirubrobacteraceae bacterium]